jgi:Phospholipase_D-nuclease N-terminal
VPGAAKRILQNSLMAKRRKIRFSHEMIAFLSQVSSAGSSSGSGGFVISFLIMAAILIGLATVGVWLWSLIHCISNRRLTDTNRLIGILLIILLGIVGSLVYLFLPREQNLQR